MKSSTNCATALNNNICVFLLILLLQFTSRDMISFFLSDFGSDCSFLELENTFSWEISLINKTCCIC